MESAIRDERTGRGRLRNLLARGTRFGLEIVLAYPHHLVSPGRRKAVRVQTELRIGRHSQGIGDFAHQGHIRLARQTQGLDDRDELRLRGQRKSNEGFR